jgi:methionine synthase I (cobalamin-dependent)
MGTELARRGVACDLPLWSGRALWAAPDVVLAIHRDEVAAGAELLTTNTFRTHRRTLAKAGRESEAAEWSRQAVLLARKAAREAERDVFVLGSVSPLEDCYRPDLVPASEELAEEHAEQVRALSRAGVDGLLVETQNTARELVAAVNAAKATGLPVIASMVTDGEGSLLSGESIAEAVKALSASPPDVLSINCVPARRVAGELDRLRAAAPASALGAYGNLGPPVDAAGLVFADEIDPAAYAALAESWIAAGARIVGGCCGTTSAHTAALAALLKQVSQTTNMASPKE